MSEVLIRFLLGGVIVSAFSLAGEVFQPKTLAGLFGAAPSVAIATLAIASAQHGRAYAATEGRSMLIGCAGLFVYGMACVAAARSQRLPVWLGAALSWIAWLAFALGVWELLRTAGVLA
jgi:hypothetical protein